MDTFFTADTHFGHANIIRYCKRPQLQPGDEVEDATGRKVWVSQTVANLRADAMDGMLINNWNNTVTKDDDVYHVGDVMFGSTARAIEILCDLKFRRLYVVWGNHDSTMQDIFRMFKAGKAPHYLAGRIIFIGHLANISVERQGITLCHYAMRVWDRSHHGNWHLYGHSHGTLADDPNSLSMDVGVDANGFRPISFDEIAIYMAKKTFKPIDHHGGQYAKDSKKLVYSKSRNMVSR